MLRTTIHRPRLRHAAAACAIGVLAVTGVVVAVQTFDGSTDTAAAEGVPPVGSSSSTLVSRDAVRPPLADAAQEAAAQVSDIADDLRAEERERQEIQDAIDDPRSAARQMLGEFGWDAGQFGCLDHLWSGESGWNPSATNPTSGAYGIPQALPGGKMASAGEDWRTNPLTQIRWGLGYIRDVYGSPCGATSFKSGRGWY